MSDEQKHRDTLAWFIKHEHSLGIHGVASVLEGVRASIDYLWCEAAWDEHVEAFTRELKRLNDKHAGALSRIAKQGWFCYGLLTGIIAMFILQGIVKALGG